MEQIKATTKKGQYIIQECNEYGRGDIWNAYDRPSATKVRSYQEIERRAQNTPGYCYDLHIVGASSHFFSTVYSYIMDGYRHIIKDTKANTYEVIIPA